MFFISAAGFGGYLALACVSRAVFFARQSDIVLVSGRAPGGMPGARTTHGVAGKNAGLAGAAAIYSLYLIHHIGVQALLVAFDVGTQHQYRFALIDKDIG